MDAAFKLYMKFLSFFYLLCVTLRIEQYEMQISSPYIQRISAVSTSEHSIAE